MNIMKKIVMINAFFLSFAFYQVNSFAQTLFIPNGTMGIGISASAGAVGIGTSTPLMKLDIHKGDLSFTADGAIDEAFVFFYQHWMQNGSLVLSTWVPSLPITQQPPSKQWVFTADGEFRSYGKIWAPEIGVKTPPFPDYVFEEDYEMLSISELGKYINENKHLPGVPSAKEVDKNGIGIGEFQTKLLEKIEELTLYVLDLSSKNEELQKQLDQIESDIAN